MSCEHIQITKVVIGKQDKQSCVLSLYTCQKCGHKWKELKESKPPRNTVWTWG